MFSILFQTVEIGVSGVVRHHQYVVLAPEPIIAAAPSLFEVSVVLEPGRSC